MQTCKILFFGLLAVIGSAAFGQKLTFGPDLGGNFLPVEKDTFGVDFQPTINVGGYINYEFNSYFSLRSGVYFTQKNHTYTENDTGQLNLFGLEEQIEGLDGIDLSTFSRTKRRTAQYYIELPLLAGYTYKKFTAYAGPHVGYMLFAKSKIEEETKVPALQVIDVASFDPDGQFSAFLPAPYSYTFRKSNTKSGLNNLDFGIRAGVNFQFDRIGINAFYNFGLLNYRTAIEKTYSYFQLTASYQFTWFDNSTRYN